MTAVRKAGFTALLPPRMKGGFWVPMPIVASFRSWASESKAPWRAGRSLGLETSAADQSQEVIILLAPRPGNVPEGREGVRGVYSVEDSRRTLWAASKVGKSVYFPGSTVGQSVRTVPSPRVIVSLVTQELSEERRRRALTIGSIILWRAAEVALGRWTSTVIKLEPDLPG